MLESFLHQKKTEPEYVCALVVTNEVIQGALFETKLNGAVNVLQTSFQSYTGEWEAAINACDQVVSVLEQKLENGKQLQKVVFGLFPEWLSEDKIKDSYLKKLKQLTTALSLTPLGFVEIPMAIVNYLQQQEGSQQTVILVGFEEQYITVSLYKIGKLIGTETVRREEYPSLDVEKALLAFSEIEVLPSRMLVYGTVSNLSQIEHELLNYPWQKKTNFLHFPKISTMPEDAPVNAVAIASGKELIPHTEEMTAPQPAVESVEGEPQSETIPTDQTTLGQNPSDMIVQPEIEQQPPQTMADAVSYETPQQTFDAATMENTENVENITPLPTPTPIKQRFPKLSLPLPRLALPSSFSVSQLNPPKIVAVIVLILFLFAGGGIFVGLRQFSSAQITLLVEPQVADKTQSITVDPHITQADLAASKIPGEQVNVEVEGNYKISTTGKKTIGDKAKGEVIIYNKTLNTKVFKAGTVFSSGSISFVLDSEVNVASASESLGSLTYGTTKASATARNIGTESNIAAGTNFTFNELPGSSYSARNETAFSGGTSKDIKVVAREDYKKVKDEALVELKQQAQEKLQKEKTGNIILISESLESTVSKEQYSTEIGEEADELSLTLAVKISGLTYAENNLYELVDSVLSKDVPSGFTYRRQDLSINGGQYSEKDDDTWVFNPHILVKLYPTIETDSLVEKLTGKNIEEATSFLRTTEHVSGVEYQIDSPFSFLKDRIPYKSDKVSITISSL